MRIGIISDTHNQHARTAAAVQLLLAEGAEVLIHCGDLCDSQIVDTCALLPCYFVFGNNDFASPIRTAISKFSRANCLELGGEVELAGKRIAVTHGHLNNEVQRLLAANPDYLFSGHSHLHSDWQEGKTRRINPGALHRARSFTVALLNLDGGELRFLEVPK